jgi:two-component system, NarL family, response regulator DevR
MHTSVPTMGPIRRAGARLTHARQRPIRLLVVDDHPAVRRGLAQLLDDQPDFEDAAVAATASSAVTQAETERFDVAVIDYHLGGRNGLWVCRRLKRLPRPPRVVIYSAYANDHLAASCVVAGADALLNKGGLGSELCEAIRAVAHGRRVLPRIPRPMAELLSRRLTDAELPIFAMLLGGTRAFEIRQALDISQPQFAAYEAAMLRKLEALPGEVHGPGAARDRIDLEQLIPQHRADAGLSM